MNEIKDAIESVWSRIMQMEDRISELEEKNFEIKSYNRPKTKNKNEGRKSTYSLGLDPKGKH